MYQAIKQYYTLGLYTRSDLDLFVSVGWITQDQENELLK